MSFVIKKPSASNRTIRLPDELIEQIGTIATSKEISFNKLVEQCCYYALDNLKDMPIENPKNKKTDT